MITASQHLNADQLKAVEHPGGPLLVLAGPGTGKTGALVERISHLVADQGVSPERILALTFSRRASDEMRTRVTSRLPEAEKVEVRTFHSFALSIVRRHASSLGLRSAPEIVPTNEQWALVADILGEENGRRRYDRVVLLYPPTEPAVDRAFHQAGLALQVRQFDLRKICDPDTGHLDVEGEAREFGRALSWDVHRPQGDA